MVVIAEFYQTLLQRTSVCMPGSWTYTPSFCLEGSPAKDVWCCGSGELSPHSFSLTAKHGSKSARTDGSRLKKNRRVEVQMRKSKNCLQNWKNSGFANVSNQLDLVNTESSMILFTFIVSHENALVFKSLANFLK